MLCLYKKILMFVLFIFMCMSAMPVTVYAGTKEINKLKMEIKENTDSLKETKEKLDIIKNNINTETEKLTDANIELTGLEEKITEKHEDIKLRIQYLYENGDTSMMSALVADDTYSAVLDKQDLFFNVHLYDRMKLDEYGQLVEDADNKKKELESRIQNLESMKEEKIQLSKDLEKMIANNRRQLKKEIEREKKRKEEERKRKEEERKKREEEIAAAKRSMPVGRYVSDGGTYSYDKSDLYLIYAIVMQECNISYEGALAVITCACNRAESPRWSYLGKDPLSQLTARGQFCYSIDNYWRKYLGNNVSQIVRDAVHDALNGKRNHRFLSFRGYVVKGSTNFGDNYFFSPM